MMEYFSYKKAKKHLEKAPKSKEPVLNDEDEAFLYRITSQVEGTPPPLPERPQDLSIAGDSINNHQQLVLADSEEAWGVPLPDVPDTPEGVMAGIEGEDLTQGKGKGKEKAVDSKKNRWSFLHRDGKEGKRKAAADDLHSAAENMKGPDAAGSETKSEATKEEEEMTIVLEKLNLAAVNNRVFSISQESQDLLRKYVDHRLLISAVVS